MVGVCLLGVRSLDNAIMLDTPKDTPRTPSLEKRSIGAKSNPGPNFGFEMANEGSDAYARMAK